MGGLRSLWGGLFVTAQTSEDMTFVHSGWDEGIEPWRFQLPGETNLDPILAHTIFDRTLLRAGETVHMKHVLRQHTTKGFSMVPQNQMAQTRFDRARWQRGEIRIPVEVGWERNR